MNKIKDERAKLVNELTEQGHEVVDTIFEEFPMGIGPDKAPVWYLGKSIQAMAEADAVVFMQGWENARGCKIEYEVAKNYGKFIKIL